MLDQGQGLFVKSERISHSACRMRSPYSRQPNFQEGLANLLLDGWKCLCLPSVNAVENVLSELRGTNTAFTDRLTICPTRVRRQKEESGEQSPQPYSGGLYWKCVVCLTRALLTWAQCWLYAYALAKSLSQCEVQWTAWEECPTRIGSCTQHFY